MQLLQEHRPQAADRSMGPTTTAMHQSAAQLLYLGRIFIDDPDQILAPLQESFGGRISFKVCLEKHHKSYFIISRRTKPGQKVLSVQTHQQETGLLQRWSRHVGFILFYFSPAQSCLDTNHKQKGGTFKPSSNRC